MFATYALPQVGFGFIDLPSLRLEKPMTLELMWLEGLTALN